VDQLGGRGNVSNRFSRVADQDGEVGGLDSKQLARLGMDFSSSLLKQFSSPGGYRGPSPAARTLARTLARLLAHNARGSGTT
jgi:hypothetical protein